MAKKKPRKPDMSISQEALDALVLVTLRHRNDGLAAALVYCSALGISLPDWAIRALARQQCKTTFSANRVRQRKLYHQMGVFAKDLLRYKCVRLTQSTRDSREEGKIGKVLTEIEGLVDRAEGLKGILNGILRLRRKNHIIRSAACSAVTC